MLRRVAAAPLRRAQRLSTGYIHTRALGQRRFAASGTGRFGEPRPGQGDGPDGPDEEDKIKIGGHETYKSASPDDGEVIDDYEPPLLTKLFFQPWLFVLGAVYVVVALVKFHISTSFALSNGIRQYEIHSARDFINSAFPATLAFFLLGMPLSLGAGYEPLPERFWTGESARLKRGPNL